MNLKEEVTRLLASLSEDKVVKVLTFVRDLAVEEADEPLTVDDLADLAEAEAEIARGEGEDLEVVAHRLGL